MPIKTITTMYRTNVRAVLLYGTPLIRSVKELVRLDEKMLQLYFKRLMHTKDDLNSKLLSRICIRFRIPSLIMEIERQTRMWTLKLGRRARLYVTTKVKQHVKDAILAIEQLPSEVPIKKYFTRGPFNPDQWEQQTFARWRNETLTGNAKSRVVDKVTQLGLQHDIFDSPQLTRAEKRSGWRYITYRFPTDTIISEQEEEAPMLLLKEKLTPRERCTVMRTLKTVHSRDLGSREAKASAEVLANLANLHHGDHDTNI